MSMKYDYLEELKNNFITALQKETRKANNEDDMDELETITEELMCETPIELAQKDYWTRSAIKIRINKDKQNNTNYINKLMRYIYSQDAVYIGDYAQENIKECAEEFESLIKTKQEEREDRIEKDSRETIAEIKKIIKIIQDYDDLVKILEKSNGVIDNYSFSINEFYTTSDKKSAGFDLDFGYMGFTITRDENNKAKLSKKATYYDYDEKEDYTENIYIDITTD